MFTLTPQMFDKPRRAIAGSLALSDGFATGNWPTASSTSARCGSASADGLAISGDLSDPAADRRLDMS